jgi:hypothetical protein
MSIHNNLKLQPQHFWKCISNFRKHRSSSIQLEFGGAHFIEPNAVADVFPMHFQSVCNNLCLMDIPSLSSSSEFLSLTPFSDADACEAIKKLKTSKHAGLEGVPMFVIKAVQ